MLCMVWTDASSSVRILSRTCMMTSRHGNVVGYCWPFVRGNTGYRWVPLTKGQLYKYSMFCLQLPWTNNRVEHTVVLPATWDSITLIMMTSSNGSIFRVNGPLCGEFTGRRTKASDAELWCFLSSPPWIYGWVHNREAGDLRRYRAHYHVIVMVTSL